LSRYRPPRPRSSPYITPAGAGRLQSELSRLWKVERPAVTQKVKEAAAQGDRSENADYIYGKRQLRQIDSRIQFLSKRLDALTVVDKPPRDQTRIFFGAWVSLADDAGENHRYRLVGPDEFDVDPAYISIDSPMARALLKKQVDDEVTVGLGEQEKTYWITAISYQTER